MHLVGFIIGIYHDARSPERQIFVYFIEIVTAGHSLHVSAVSELKISNLPTRFIRTFVRFSQ